MRPMGVLLMLMLATGVFAQALDVPNLDFSKGKEGWTEWSGTTAHKWDVEPAGGFQGRPALRIDATSVANDVMVMTATDKLNAGERYRAEAWWRIQARTPNPEVNLRIIFRDAAGKWISGDDYLPLKETQEKGWTHAVYRVQVPKGTAAASVGIWVRNADATVRVSGLRFEPAPPGARTFDSMYLYDPMQVELGNTPLNAFLKLRETQSPFLPRADRWNRLLVRVGCLQEDLARSRRTALYAGRATEQVVRHEQAVEGILADLDVLQQTYGRLYAAKKPEALETDFDPAIAKLEERVKQAETALADWQSMVARVGKLLRPLTWRTVDKTQPWWDPEKKTNRYLLWTRWSTPEFWDLEKPLDLGPGHTLTSGAPASFTGGKADWSNYMTEWEKKRCAGATESSLITHYALHDRGYLAPEFAEAQGNDPELRLVDAEGKPLGTPAGVTNINWLDGRVRGHMLDVLGQMAAFFKDKPEFKFYVTAWESAGPYAGGVRVGANPSHVAAFQDYLKKRYGTIEALNKRWGTAHKDFAELLPVPESSPKPGEASTPQAIESQRWAHESYVDYLDTIRDAVAAKDPTKPVVGQQSGLMDRVLSPRVWEGVDILGYHNRGRTTMPMMVWLASTQRYTKQPTSLFENFWGCQEDHPKRMAEEKVMRAQMRRYLFRHAVWGRAIQVWWYAYTSAPYLLSYNGNWFNPVYDLTTFRYCAAGYPVEKAKVDRFESLLLDSEIVPSKVVLVQPYASMLAQGRNGATWREWVAWHNVLYPADVKYEALPDMWFEEGKANLDDFKVVILPFAPHLSEAFTKQLMEFMGKGGTVIASGLPGVWDDLGRPNGGLLKAVGFPTSEMTAEGATWSVKGSTPGVVESNRLAVLTAPLERLSQSAQGFALSLVEKAAEKVAEAPGTSLELLLRRLPDGREVLCVLNADPDKAAKGTVSVQGAFREVMDLDQATPLLVPSKVEKGRTRFETVLEAGGTAYYMLVK